MASNAAGYYYSQIDAPEPDKLVHTWTAGTDTYSMEAGTDTAARPDPVNEQRCRTAGGGHSAFY